MELVGMEGALRTQSRARCTDSLHGLRMAAGDGGDFIEREALDPVEEKGFAVGAVGATERGLHQGNHFVGIGSLLRSETRRSGMALSRVKLSSG